MSQALVDLFGEPLLKQLGLDNWCPPFRLRPSRELTRRATDGSRTPNALRMLLISRLVTDNIATLWIASGFESTPKGEPLPTGYGRRSGGERARVGKTAIVSALDAAKGRITVAAQYLGVHSFALASDMRHHGIRLRLPEITLRRLGAKLVDGVREALEQGITKNEIQLRYGISAWSVLLIELDRPELSETHRNSTILRQREKHRNALLSFLRDTPNGTRRLFAVKHAGSYDWLRQYDRDWLVSHLPQLASGGREGLGRSRRDWHQIDQVAASGVRQAAQQEFAKADRPIRLTRSRLLSAVGALAALGQTTRHRYPTALAEAERLAETKEQFMRRLIRWALQEYAGRHVAISTNQLRRVARLPARELMEHRKCIIEIAGELGLSFDARCTLAPWRDDASEGSTLMIQ